MVSVHVADAGPIAHSIMRYPVGMTFFTTPERLEIGKGRIIKQGTSIAILSYGARLQEALRVPLAATIAFRHSTVASLTTHLLGELLPAAPPPNPEIRPAPLAGISVHLVDRSGAAQTELRLGHAGVPLGCHFHDRLLRLRLEALLRPAGVGQPGQLLANPLDLTAIRRRADAAQLTASDPADKGMLFEPAASKIYRHPTFYEVPDEVGHM